MVVYIEYALAENFLFDCCLLYLSLKAARLPILPVRIGLSATFGAIFAVVFPLLQLSIFLAYVLKFSVGFLLCLIVQKRVKTKNEWGRYALNVVYFFLFSFLFGGVLTGLFSQFFSTKTPSALAITGFAVLTVFCAVFIKKAYEKRVLRRYIYDCRIRYKQKFLKISAFFDSGNFATKNGLPVCFLSPNAFYDLIGERFFEKGMGQVRDEIVITTLGGEKKLPLYQGEIEMITKEGCIKKEVYFATSANMLSRDYEMIFGCYVFEGIVG